MSVSSLYTVDEYLAIERSSQDRHEYLDGQIFDMAGESLDHGRISTNLVMLLANQLKGTLCEVLSKDMKVRSGPIPRRESQSKSGLYSYPDLVVVCGEPQFHDEHQDVLLNPAVILEVLSQSTEAFDRGEKLRRYQLWNPTLADYVLVSQERPQIDHYVRQSGPRWSFTIIQGLDEIVRINSIKCELRLADIFDRVKFSEAVDKEF